MKLPQFIRKKFARVLACLIPHVQIDHDRQERDHYVGKRYVAPNQRGWFEDKYIQMVIIVMCWMGLLTNYEYWDGLRTEMIYGVEKDGERLRDEFFPIQGPQIAPPNIFTGSNTPGVSTARRFVKETEPAA